MKFNFLRGRVGLCLTLTLTVVGINGFRALGLKWVQRWELSAFDHFSQRQPQELTNERIAIVGITEGDLKQLQASELDDLTLAQLLERIKEQQPRAIGLALIRDLPVPPGTRLLEQVFRTTPNLFGVGKLTELPGDPYFERIDPPPILQEQARVGDVSVMVDGDGVVRRGNLFPTTGESAIPSLGLLLAHHYLKEAGIVETTAPDGALQWGEVAFPIFEANDGGYVGADAGGYQILMNWYYKPQSFPQVSVTDVLDGSVPDGWFRGRIVLIGYYTPSLKKDLFYTPLSGMERGKTPRQAFGVEVHANLAAYLLGTVLDGRPRLRAIPELGEMVLIGLGVFLSGGLVWALKGLKAPLALITAGFGLAAGISLLWFEAYYYLFLLGWWLPVVPAVAGIWLGALLSLLYILRERNLEYIEGLEGQVRQRTEALEAALTELKVKQEQLIEREKLAFLGRLTAGFCHQFKNPLYLLKHGFATVIEGLGADEPGGGENFPLIAQLLRDLQEPLDKLELLFKLILIPPSQKKVAWLEAAPNELVNSIVESAVKFRVSGSRQSILSQIERQWDPHLQEPRKVPQQLEIPLFNVIENALDAVLTREKEDPDFRPEIQISTHVGDGSWEVAVADNGGGILPGMADKLFEPFTTSKAETEGIGLGLYISREVIERIGGQISVETEADKGSKFTLTVPFPPSP